MKLHCAMCKKKKDESEFHRSLTRGNGRQGNCKECKLAYSREWKRTNKDKFHESAYRHMRKYPEHYRAYSKVKEAVSRGRLHKQLCEVCGEERVDAHHHDYSRPLDVKWLCRKHHSEIHHKVYA